MVFVVWSKERRLNPSLNPRPIKTDLSTAREARRERFVKSARSAIRDYRSNQVFAKQIDSACLLMLVAPIALLISAAFMTSNLSNLSTFIGLAIYILKVRPNVKDQAQGLKEKTRRLRVAVRGWIRITRQIDSVGGILLADADYYRFINLIERDKLFMKMGRPKSLYDDLGNPSPELAEFVEHWFSFVDLKSPSPAVGLPDPVSFES